MARTVTMMEILMMSTSTSTSGTLILITMLMCHFELSDVKSFERYENVYMIETWKRPSVYYYIPHANVYETTMS